MAVHLMSSVEELEALYGLIEAAVEAGCPIDSGILEVAAAKYLWWLICAIRCSNSQ